MADTTMLKTKVEPFICEELEKSYPGHAFAPKAIPLRKKRDGTCATHEFDAVSDDTTIVASIKSHSWKTSADPRVSPTSSNCTRPSACSGPAPRPNNISTTDAVRIRQTRMRPPVVDKNPKPTRIIARSGGR